MDYRNYLAWVDAGNTPAPAPTRTPDQIIASYILALDGYFDQVAQAAGFDSRLTFISRAGYVGPFQSAAQAFGAWMDGCYVQAQGIRAQVLSGEIDPPPTLEEVIAMLPAPPDLQGGA